jgi:hypothetical protein
MNSLEFSHDYYEELCALAALGQISSAEHRELHAHLSTCRTCRLRQDDFTEIPHEHPAAIGYTERFVGLLNFAFHNAS